MEAGLELSIDDFVDEFVLVLESEVWELKQKQAALGCLTVLQESRLRLLERRVLNLQKRTNLKYLRARLAYVCNVLTRNPSNVIPFTDAENDVIKRLSWQSFDWLLYLLATGSAEQLQPYMCQAKEFVEESNRRSLVVTAHDAVPVYLDASTGKVVVRAEVLDEMRHRNLATKLAKDNSESALVMLTGAPKLQEAEGSSRRQKNRLTLIMRQSLHGVLDPDVYVPEGRIRDAVLLVPAAKPARLEDMSFAEPSYWLRDHSIDIDGHVIVRKAGDKVGPLGKEWRESRRALPALFYRGRSSDSWQPGAVRIWFQPKSTEDGIIAAWLSDLNVEEGDRFSLNSTDCVASEHSTEMRLKKWLNNSVQHTIGMRQTWATQVTDVRFAKIGKDGAESMRSRRFYHRLKAKQFRVASTLCSAHLDLMLLAIAMQTACIRDNQKNRGVLKAFRMGGWAAYKRTAAGMVPAIGEAYREFPLGSSRIRQSLIEKRFDWLDADGRPLKPNWNDLRDIRLRQEAEAAKIRTSNVDIPGITDINSEICDFIDFLGGVGEAPFEDRLVEAGDRNEDVVMLPWIPLDELCVDANFLALHPRLRKELVARMEMQFVKDPTPKTRQKGKESQHVKHSKADTTRTLKLEYQELVDKLGLEKARENFVPVAKPKRKPAEKKKKRRRIE